MRKRRASWAASDLIAVKRTAEDTKDGEIQMRRSFFIRGQMALFASI